MVRYNIDEMETKVGNDGGQIFQMPEDTTSDKLSFDNIISERRNTRR
jgi:hypothetical protein